LKAHDLGIYDGEEMLQNLVLPRRPDVFDSLTLAEGEHLGGSEAAVQAHALTNTFFVKRPQPEALVAE
jgi:hypothetical protein